MHVEDMARGEIGYVRLTSVISWKEPEGRKFAIEPEATVLRQHLLNEVLLSREPDGSYRLHIPRNVQESDWSCTERRGRQTPLRLTPKYM